MLAAIMNKRKGIGCEIIPEYMDEARKRVEMLENGTLPYRPLGKPVHKPSGKEKVSQIPVTAKNITTPLPILYIQDSENMKKRTIFKVQLLRPIGPSGVTTHFFLGHCALCPKRRFVE